MEEGLASKNCAMQHEKMYGKMLCGTIQAWKLLRGSKYERQSRNVQDRRL
jgi:hypothetical protein